MCVCARALVNRASRIHCSLCEFISDLSKIPDWKYKPLNRIFREGEESGLAESDYATLIVSADGGEKKKMEENSKKGDSKGSSGRAEAGASGKEGTTSGANVGMKSKQDGGDGSKRLVSHRAKKRFSQYVVVQQNWIYRTTPLVMFYCCIPYRRDLSRSLYRRTNGFPR